MKPVVTVTGETAVKSEVTSTCLNAKFWALDKVLTQSRKTLGACEQRQTQGGAVDGQQTEDEDEPKQKGRKCLGRQPRWITKHAGALEKKSTGWL